MAGPTNLSIWIFREEVLDVSDIAGYSIEATDGEIGKVDKHVVDPAASYLLVATGPWIFGKTVMLPAGVISRIDDEKRVVYVDRTKEEIKNAPEYREDLHDDTGYRSQLGSYYDPLGQPDPVSRT
jgi:hypothetical protein